MAERFTVPIDFNQQPTTGFRVPRLAADPSTPNEGEMWINTTTNLLKIYINSVVKTVTFAA